MKDFLNEDQKIILQEAHHSSQLRKNADRIKAILLLDGGFSYEQVAEILLLDDMTVRRYEKEYTKTGVDGLLEYRYHGTEGFLTELQEKDLIKYLRAHICQTVKEAVSYVNTTYGKTYSVAGMTHLLHRLNFVYKKTKMLPGKVDREKQELFKQEYEKLKSEKKPEDRIYFVDASHPHHNNMPFYGWMYKGEPKTIKTNTGRKRVNLNGAVNLEDMRIIVLSEPTINTEAMKRLILEIEKQQPRGDIYLVLDNASYNHSYELQRFIAIHTRVHLQYLPAYSPNLNTIERLWKFFHTKHHDKYFEKFKEFEQAVLSFFQHIHQYDHELKTLLTDNFQTLPT